MSRNDDEADESPEPPSRSATRAVSVGESDDGLRQRLEAAADGLLFMSEGDAPFEFFRLPTPADGPSTSDDAGIAEDDDGQEARDREPAAASSPVAARRVDRSADAGGARRDAGGPDGSDRRDAEDDVPGVPLAADEFRARLGVGADVPVETVPLDRFFARHVEDADPADPVMQEQAPRFRALREALRRELTGARVFRVGEVEVRAYAAGRTPDGGVAGLATTLYET